MSDHVPPPHQHDPPPAAAAPRPRTASRTRWYRRLVVQCVLAVLAGLLGVISLPSTAEALPPGDKRLATWNMQNKRENFDALRNLARDNHVVALQEFPYQGAAGNRTPYVPGGASLIPPDPGAPAEINEYLWNIGTDLRPEYRYLYLMRQNSRQIGMVTSEPLEPIVVAGNYRDALALYDLGSDTLYASIHASADGGSDAASLVRRVRAEAEARGTDWAVLGDFNRDPANLQNQLTGPENIISSGQVTHPNGRSELDYLVTNLAVATWPAAVMTGTGTSDHWPVAFGVLGAGGQKDQTYRFRWYLHNQGIGVANDRTDNDALIEHTELRHSRSQVWKVLGLNHFEGTTYTQLQNLASGKCLDMTGNPSSPRLRQIECASPANLGQLWSWDPQLRNLFNAAGGQLRHAPEYGPNALGVHYGPLRETSHWLMEPVNMGNWDTAGFRNTPGYNTIITDSVTRHPLYPHGTGVYEGFRPENPFAPLEEQWYFQPSGVPGGMHIRNASTHNCMDVWSAHGRAQTQPCVYGDRSQAWEYNNGMIRNLESYVLGYDESIQTVDALLGNTDIFNLDLAFGHFPDWGATVPRLAVMPLGDSITLGVGSNTRTGYRPALARSLATDVRTVEFVGSQQDADGTRHEGHSGWRIDQIQANIEPWLAEAKPNVVLLHIGTNDMNRNYQVATAPQRLGGLLDQIHAASPDTTVVVASLVPAVDRAVQERVDAYNRAIPGIVADRAQRGYKISQVSMSALTTSDLNDRLHPNNSGYVKMGNAFRGGIVGVAQKGWVKETVVVKPAPPRRATGNGDYDVDINGDGRADYLVVDDNGGVRAWLNTGPGQWSDQGYIASGSADFTGSQIRFADIGGDARADYLIVNPNGAVRAFVNTGGNGRGGWQDKGVIASGSSAWTGDQVRFADIGGDARADYVVVSANGATRALLNTTDATTGVIKWADQGVIASGSAAWTGDQVRFADIGGDARADYLVVEDNGATHGFVNTGGNGRGGWQDQDYIASGSSSWQGSQVRFADINGDARADYLVVDDNGAVHAYAHTADATTGVIKWADQGVIASGVGVPGYRVRI
ncbi:GDSL-type esterase/lipase family protein [Streptomyces sp. NPDC051567]|uniref:GDSL-type esterase/lipase family protein n=1 Tax=Streptomyces sp. NPDC051567 TaxID=3365660 RepID=UPI0037A09FE1